MSVAPHRPFLFFKRQQGSINTSIDKEKCNDVDSDFWPDGLEYGTDLQGLLEETQATEASQAVVINIPDEQAFPPPFCL